MVVKGNILAVFSFLLVLIEMFSSESGFGLNLQLKTIQYVVGAAGPAGTSECSQLISGHLNMLITSIED